MEQSFLSRYERLLSGRSPYAWGNTVGVGRGVAQRMSEGIVPTGETLAAIARAENCSISWLLDGLGAPFLVGTCPSDEECADHLDELLVEKDWTIHLVTDDKRLTLVLTQPGWTNVKGRVVNYTILEVLAGPIGPLSLEHVARYGGALRLVNVDAKTLDSLNGGQMGTYSLVDKGLLAHGRDIGPAHPILKSTTTEARPEYAVSGDEGELLEAFRRLDTPRRRAALAALKAMKDG